MATLWRCRSRVRLRHIVSNYTPILHFRHAFSTSFLQYQRISLSRNASEHAMIWRKRSRLLLEVRSNKDEITDDERPDLKLLQAAIWHDFYQNTNRTLFSDKEQTDRILGRITDLYDEMTSIGISIDNRWCKIMIATFSSILNKRSRSEEGISYTEMLRFLRFARKMFLQVFSELSQTTYTNTALIHGILDLEMQVASALIREAKSNQEINRNQLNEHLHWVTDMANMMASIRGTISQDLSHAEEVYQQDLISLSSTKAGTTTINLFILQGDHARALKALQVLLKHAANITRSVSTRLKSNTQHLRRIEQNKSIARSALISFLVTLCKDVRKEGNPFRSMITEVVKLAYESVEDGLWDIMRGDHQSRSELHSRMYKGPSYDFARLCVRAINAVSPASTRRRRATDGVKYETLHGDEKQHCEDFFTLLKTVSHIRSSSVARELAQTLRQTTADQPLPSFEPIAQPWRRAFRAMFDINREMSARIVWCLFSQWSRNTMRISKEDQEQDENARLRANEEADVFLKRFAFVLNDFMISFGMSEASWQAAAIALQKTLHLAPCQKCRKEAKIMFEEAYEKARRNNFGAIPQHKKDDV